MHETRVQSLGQEDPLEEEMATHSGNFAWKNSMDRRAWEATVNRVAKSWTRVSRPTHTDSAPTSPSGSQSIRLPLGSLGTQVSPLSPPQTSLSSTGLYAIFEPAGSTGRSRYARDRLQILCVHFEIRRCEIIKGKEKLVNTYIYFKNIYFYSFIWLCQVPAVAHGVF